jgi:hypothetical protein
VVVGVNEGPAPCTAQGGAAEEREHRSILTQPSRAPGRRRQDEPALCPMSGKAASALRAIRASRG